MYHLSKLSAKYPRISASCRTAGCSSAFSTAVPTTSSPAVSMTVGMSISSGGAPILNDNEMGMESSGGVLIVQQRGPPARNRRLICFVNQATNTPFSEFTARRTLYSDICVSTWRRCWKESGGTVSSLTSVRFASLFSGETSLFSSVFESPCGAYKCS